MEQEQIQKKSPFWVLWGIGATIVVLLFGFYGWKTWSLNRDNERLETAMTNLRAQLQEMAPGATEQFLKRQQESLTRAKKYRTEWSIIMEQLTALETQAVRFVSLNMNEGRVSASCQATSWNTLSAFVNTLEEDDRIHNIRISKTTVLNPPIAGASQGAEISFSFSPTMP